MQSEKIKEMVIDMLSVCDEIQKALYPYATGEKSCASEELQYLDPSMNLLTRTMKDDWDCISFLLYRSEHE